MVQRKKMEEIENENNDMAIGYASQQNPSSCYWKFGDALSKLWWQQSRTW